jgi:hypothetical protein
VDLSVEVFWSKNRSAWSGLFSGYQSTVIPTSVVLDTVVKAGDVIDFAARAYTHQWMPLQSTGTGGHNLLVLKNGDPLPQQLAAMQYGQLRSYLKPYLSTDGKTVRIGDRDLLILMELDETNRNVRGFDYQDLGLIVTFD